MNADVAFATPPQAPAWRRWLIYSPLARIAIFFVLYFVVGYALDSGLTAVGVFATTATSLTRSIGDMLIRCVPALIAYLLLVRMVERRRAAELAPRRWLRDGASGIVLGAGIMSATVAIAWLLGAYHIIATQPPRGLVDIVLVWGLGAGIGEEIICRGVLFRIVEEGLGTVVALFVSALYFGAAHAQNPHATVWSVIAIAIEAGLLLGMLYHVTRSLTLCIGLHAAWNVVEGGVFGIPVSGAPAQGWLVSQSGGPEWLSGGGFGIEASVIALGTCSLVTLALLMRALKKRTFVAPFWMRQSIGDGALAAR